MSHYFFSLFLLLLLLVTTTIIKVTSATKKTSTKPPTSIPYHSCDINDAVGRWAFGVQGLIPPNNNNNNKHVVGGVKLRHMAVGTLLITSTGKFTGGVLMRNNGIPVPGLVQIQGNVTVSHQCEIIIQGYKNNDKTDLIKYIGRFSRGKEHFVAAMDSPGSFVTADFSMSMSTCSNTTVKWSYVYAGFGQRGSKRHQQQPYVFVGSDNYVGSTDGYMTTVGWSTGGALPEQGGPFMNIHSDCLEYQVYDDGSKYLAALGQDAFYWMRNQPGYEENGKGYRGEFDCGNTGEWCQRGSSCCSGYCNLQPPLPANTCQNQCTPNQHSCSSNSQCCSGQCDSNMCSGS
jgi:hypothetical protein